MNPSIELAVFDIAGTTMKDSGEVAIALQKAFLEKGYAIPIEKINPLMGYKKIEAIQLLLEKNIDPHLIQNNLIDSIHQRLIKLLIDFYSTSSEVQALPHVEDIFSWLKKNNIKIGLDTGFSKQITEIIIEKLGWLKTGKIDYVVSSDEVPAGRPKPYMIHKIMTMAGITDPKKVIKIGDTEVDINEGKNAGCLYSIGVTTGAFTREQLEPFQPSFIIDDLNQLKFILEPSTITA